MSEEEEALMNEAKWPPANGSEVTTIIVDLPQFQHYYSPELEQFPEAEIRLDKKYGIRSCLTMMTEGESKRCTCKKYLLMRPRSNSRVSFS